MSLTRATTKPNQWMDGTTTWFCAWSHSYRYWTAALLWSSSLLLLRRNTLWTEIQIHNKVNGAKCDNTKLISFKNTQPTWCVEFVRLVLQLEHYKNKHVEDEKDIWSTSSEVLFQPLTQLITAWCILAKCDHSYHYEYISDFMWKNWICTRSELSADTLSKK